MSKVEVKTKFIDNYKDYYTDDISEWRSLGAIDKFANIITLASKIKHDKILEIGCGDGSILKKLSQKNVGKEYFGLEISESGVEETKKRKIKGLIECKLYDGYKLPYPDNEFDLVISTHVLEHVEHPRMIISEALRVGKYSFFEVPAEHTIWLKKNFVFDSVGHINFYTPNTFRNLIQSCDAVVIDQIVTTPSLKVHKYISKSIGPIKYLIKKITYFLFPSVASSLFTYYTAILCKPKAEQ